MRERLEAIVEQSGDNRLELVQQLGLFVIDQQIEVLESLPQRGLRGYLGLGNPGVNERLAELEQTKAAIVEWGAPRQEVQ